MMMIMLMIAMMIVMMIVIMKTIVDMAETDVGQPVNLEFADLAKRDGYLDVWTDHWTDG